MAAPPKHTRLTLCRRLVHQARPSWPHLTAVFFLSLLAAPLTLLTPLPLRIAVDSVIGSHPVPGFLQPLLPAVAAESKTVLLVLTGGLVVAVALLVHLQGLASWLLQTYTGETLVLGFRSELFRHLQRLSLSYHDTKGTTDSTFRIQYDAPSIQWILVDGLTPLVTSAFTLAGVLYVTARIDWQLALVALAVSPMLLVLSKASSRRLRSGWYELKELQSSAMSVVQEALAAIRVVRAFGQEDREHDRFVRHASQSMRGQVRLALVEGSFDLLVGLAVATGTAAALFIGVLHVRSGSLTLGELLVVVAYLNQLYGPLQTITKKVAELQASIAGAERAFSLLDEVPDVMERPHARPLLRASGAVAFESASFAYGSDRPVLQDVCFDISPGTRVAVMGATGAGKTTLVSLLTRFFDPSAGRILLDGIDLRDYRLADLRDQFGIVLQEPVLFSSSIHENIAYARPAASRCDIEAAARAANAHDFIVRLADGYDTQVGERGMRLSGGERQRVSLARAFLKNAPILILDEPTSAVDARTEAAIMEAMERLMHGRTTFIITHRQYLLKGCDLVLLIKEGRARMTSPSECHDPAAQTIWL